MTTDELDAALALADRFTGAGRYFEAHEELEAFWMKASGDEKTLLQGMVQIAAGLYRRALDPQKTSGAFYLLDRGAAKIARARRLLTDDSYAAFDRRFQAVRKADRAPAQFTFALHARHGGK